MNKISEKLKSVLIYCGLTKEEYKRIRMNFIEGNRVILTRYSLVSGLIMAVMAVVTYFIIPERARDLTVYTATTQLCFVIALMSATVLKKFPEQVKTLAYIFAGVMLADGIIMSACDPPDEKSVFYMACVLALPLIFVDMPIRIISAMVLSDIVFGIVVFHFKTRDAAVNDMVNAIMLSLVSLILAVSMILVKVKKYLYEDEVLVLSETDLLTGRKNRNHYEVKKDGLQDRCTGSIACVYLDANGLHELNNSKGHHEGDRMLRCIAEALREQFGDEDTYRIGGDEFLAFAYDCSEKLLVEKVKAVRKEIEKESFTAAIGMAIADVPLEEDIDILVKQAEERMFGDKRRYYETEGMDRRRRPKLKPEVMVSE